MHVQTGVVTSAGLEALLWRARAGLDGAIKWTRRMIDDASRRMRERLQRRRWAWRACFFGDRNEPSPAGVAALADLARFCRAHTTTTVVSPITRQVDPLASAIAEGRREVWLYLQKHLAVSDADILRFQALELSYD